MLNLKARGKAGAVATPARARLTYHFSSRASWRPIATVIAFILAAAGVALIIVSDALLFGIASALA
ncbi:Uncharacterised protein [Raoultella ornithinolytica]|nr:Uncharacterised protein [Raoultella ornithinolytica]